MKIRFKNKHTVYFSNHPILITACMLVVIVMIALALALQKEILIIDGTKETDVVTYKNTVDDVLKQSKISLNPKDRIWPSLEDKIEDGTKISIKRAVPVKVVADGKSMSFLSAEDTVADVLDAEDISYGKEDIIDPEPDTIVSDNMEIRIVRVMEKEITEKQKIAYSKDVKEAPDLEKGAEKVLQNGRDGEKLLKIKIKYEDGVEKSREVVDEEILKPAINTLIAVGTLNSKLTSRGEMIRFKKMLTMRATCYTDNVACTGKTGGNTATGTKPRRNSNGSKWSTVAVDPKVIPLGTKLYVEGYGYGIAEDVGGAVKGNKIDLFFTDGTKEYENWGRRKVRVYILE
ncbi:MAG TPA: hypothetical protein DD429_08510 [Clostridiaceae bacterium]|nr:hypothetical protein [Clostridiaceae bacterium]